MEELSEEEGLMTIKFLNIVVIIIEMLKRMCLLGIHKQYSSKNHVFDIYGHGLEFTTQTF